jgi:hypothetical protein
VLPVKPRRHPLPPRAIDDRRFTYGLIDDVAAASHIHAWIQQIDYGIGDDE